MNDKRSLAQDRSALEARARAAVLATAEEILPSDVPPVFKMNGAVSPLERRSSRSRVRQAARPWLVPLAAAAAVVVVAGVTAGIAATRGSNGTTNVTASATKAAPTASAVKSAAPMRAPNLETGLMWYYEPADWAQAYAGQEFWNDTFSKAENNAFEECLAQSGTTGKYTLAPGTSSAFTTALPAGVQIGSYPDLAEISAKGTLYWEPAVMVENAQPTFTGSAAYVKAGQKCIFSAQNTFSTVPNTIRNEYGNFLDLDFAKALDAAESASFKTAIPKLLACATKYGWPRTQTMNFQNFENWTDGKVEQVDVGKLTFGKGGPVTHPAPVTAATIALNKKWASIFVQCATPYLTTTGNAAIAAQKQFLAVPENQKEMQEIVDTFGETLDKVSVVKLAS